MAYSPISSLPGLYSNFATNPGLGTSTFANSLKSPTSLGTTATQPTQNIKPPSNSIPASAKSPLAPFPGGGVTTSAGGYAGNPANNPNFKAPTAPATPVGSAETNTPAVSPQTQTQTYPGLFGQAASGLVGQTSSSPQTQAQNTSQGIASNGNPSVQAQQGLYGIATNGSPAVQQAINNVKGLQQAQTEIANNPNAAAEVASGRGQAITGQINAAQTAYSNALGQQAQQITALNEAGGLQQTNQGQQISAAGQAGNLALTNQGQQITAGNAAGNLTAPQLGQYGQAYYNPVTGQASGGTSGGSLNPINNIQSIAQQVISGQLSPSQAYSLGGSVPNFQGALNAQIQQLNPNFNTGTAQANYDSNQQNRTTQGTTPVNAGAQGFTQATQDYNNTKLQVNNVSSLGNLLVQTGTGQNINPFQFAPANQTIQDFESTLSSQGQAQFQSTLAAFAGVASQLLTNSSGQIPTDVSNSITKIANGSLNMGALQALVSQANLEGSAKLGNQASQYIDYQAQLNGQPAKNLPGTYSANGTNYVLGTDGTYNPIQ